jgi:hypothetical protein
LRKAKTDKLQNKLIAEEDFLLARVPDDELERIYGDEYKLFRFRESALKSNVIDGIELTDDQRRVYQYEVDKYKLYMIKDLYESRKPELMYDYVPKRMPIDPERSEDEQRAAY